MLTKPGNTQVYSPFGSYVVEQHGTAFDEATKSSAPEAPLFGASRNASGRYDWLNEPAELRKAA